MAIPDKSPPGRSRRPQRPRRRGKKPDAPSAVNAIKQAAPVAVTGSAELPLSPDEVTRLKATFRFLKEHRATLKLRVNAAEDLLLNGLREPTHRGVCQHLLDKVEKAKVLLASERLPPAEATELLAGVIRFAPELSYLMRFLECVKASAGQEQATAALTQALGRIEFDDASNAQVRQLLALIVDIFPAQEQPVFLLSLLRGAAFRRAFDRSTDDLPAALANMLIPLRAVHQLLASNNARKRGPRGARSGGDPVRLRQGALLLMRVNPKSLLEFDGPVRRRLLQLVSDLPEDRLDVPREALLALFRSLTIPNPAERERVLVSFVGLLLRAGLEKDARALLSHEVEAQARTTQNATSTKPAHERNQDNRGRDERRREAPPANQAAELLALLGEPRVGTIALQPPRGRDNGGKKRKPVLPTAGRWYNGVHLPTLRRVRVVWGEPNDRARWSTELQLWSRTLVPQVALPLAANVSDSAPHPYWAVEHRGQSVTRRLERADANECRQLVLDLCRIHSSLSAVGVHLPDGKLTRFAVDEAGQLWLTDLSGATRIAPDDSSSMSWLLTAVGELTRLAPELSLPAIEQERFFECRTAADLATQLGYLSVPH